MNKIVKTTLFVAIDVIIVFSSWVLAAALSASDVAVCLSAWWYGLTALVLTVTVNLALGLYRKIWKYVGYADVFKLLISCAILTVWFCIVAIISLDFSISWAIICAVLYTILLTGSRLFLKALEIFERSLKANSHEYVSDKKRVMIVGAGSAANLLINDMRRELSETFIPVCALDDNVKKIGREINGVLVVGTTKQAEKFAKEYKVDQIIIAMPSVERKIVKDVILRCQKTKCKVQIFQGLTVLQSNRLADWRTARQVFR